MVVDEQLSFVPIVCLRGGYCLFGYLVLSVGCRRNVILKERDYDYVDSYRNEKLYSTGLN